VPAPPNFHQPPDTTKATIQAETQPLLDDIAEALENFPTWRLQIVGHTDSAGDSAHNEQLSRERAAAVKAALVDRGIEAARLDSEGAGQSEPVASNDTPEGRALNRRVELVRLDQQPPNILVIFGDDIGMYNIGAFFAALDRWLADYNATYLHSALGYRAPNAVEAEHLGHATPLPAAR
jgi:hypothetical protein